MQVRGLSMSVWLVQSKLTKCYGILTPRLNYEEDQCIINWSHGGYSMLYYNWLENIKFICRL